MGFTTILPLFAAANTVLVGVALLLVRRMLKKLRLHHGVRTELASIRGLAGASRRPGMDVYAILDAIGDHAEIALRRMDLVLGDDEASNGRATRIILEAAGRQSRAGRALGRLKLPVSNQIRAGITSMWTSEGPSVRRTIESPSGRGSWASSARSLFSANATIRGASRSFESTPPGTESIERRARRSRFRDIAFTGHRAKGREVPRVGAEPWRGAAAVVDSPGVNARDERVAQNEAMYRTVNREIEYAALQLGDEPTDELEVVCECGEPSCTATLRLTIAEYDDVHRERDRFAVAPGHENPALECVVKTTNDFVVVDKFGAAEAVAEAEERREGTT
jgi:hypothetical protein